MLLLLMRTRLLLLLRRAVVRVMVLSKRIARYHLYENKASFITEIGCCDQLQGHGSLTIFTPPIGLGSQLIVQAHRTTSSTRTSVPTLKCRPLALEMTPLYARHLRGSYPSAWFTSRAARGIQRGTMCLRACRLPLEPQCPGLFIQLFWVVHMPGFPMFPWALPRPLAAM